MNQGYYGVHVPRISSCNKFLIIACVILFLITSIIEFHLKVSVSSFIGLSPYAASKGFVYQFFTYPFYQESFISLIFSSLILWFIGSELEGMWGSSYYIKLLLTANFCAGIIFFTFAYLFFSKTPAFTTPLMGLTGSTFALLAVYAQIYKDRPLLFMMIFPMKAKYFCMILIGIQLYIGFFSAYSAAAWGHLGAMLFGFLFYRYSQKLSFTGGLKLKKKKKQGHLRLLKGSDDADKDGKKGNGPRYWQ